MSGPQRALLDRMPRTPLGAIVSLLCLGAAMAIRQGRPTTLVSICDPMTGRRLPSEIEAVLRQKHDEAVAVLRSATPEELDDAIALYRAHLTEMGYRIEGGYAH